MHARRQPTVGTILPLLAPSTDNVVAGVDRLDQPWNILGRILQVGVERDHNIAAAIAKPRQNRRMLAEVARQFHYSHARIAGGDFAQGAQ